MSLDTDPLNKVVIGFDLETPPCPASIKDSLMNYASHAAAGLIWLKEHDKDRRNTITWLAIDSFVATRLNKIGDLIRENREYFTDIFSIENQINAFAQYSWTDHAKTAP